MCISSLKNYVVVIFVCGVCGVLMWHNVFLICFVLVGWYYMVCVIFY